MVGAGVSQIRCDVDFMMIHSYEDKYWPICCYPRAFHVMSNLQQTIHWSIMILRMEEWYFCILPRHASPPKNYNRLLREQRRSRRFFGQPFCLRRCLQFWCFSCYRLYAFNYAVFLILLTLALSLAVISKNPKQYPGKIDKFRAFCELLTILFNCIYFGLEVDQLLK